MVSRWGWCYPRGVVASSETNESTETCLPGKKGCPKVGFRVVHVVCLVKVCEVLPGVVLLSGDQRGLTSGGVR